jgi:hypothetical protein
MTYIQLKIPWRIAQGMDCQDVYEITIARQEPKVMPAVAPVFTLELATYTPSMSLK